MDFFNQGIPLGRWFGIKVIIHWMFVLYAAYELFGDRQQSAFAIKIHALQLVLLFGTVLLHEFGHALSCRAVGGIADRIILWPLGGIAFVQPPMNPRAWLITTVCGPLVNAILWPLFWYLSAQQGLTADDGLAQLFANGSSTQFYLGLSCYLMWQINRALLLFNLIPAYPMDGGRILQEILWLAIGFRRSLQFAGLVGTIAGISFIVLGLSRHTITIPFVNFSLGGTNDTFLVFIGLMCAMSSFQIYRRSQQIIATPKN